MKLTKKDKDVIKVIKRLCKLPEETIIQVFKGLFIVHIMEAYAKNDTHKISSTFGDLEINIPYLMSYQMKLNYKACYENVDPIDIEKINLADDLKEIVKKMLEGDNTFIRENLIEDTNAILREILNVTLEDDTDYYT